MGIEKIKAKAVSFVQEVGQKSKQKVQKVVQPAGEKVTNGKEKLTNSLLGLANNAKASIAGMKNKIDISKSGDMQAFKNGQKHRMDSLISESLAAGMSKKQAKNAADALVRATGDFSQKDASKSAEILKDAPLPQAILKQELLAKRANKLNK